MKILLIAAMAKNRVIGRGNTIPWHIPGEQQRFKAITMGHTLIMGRKTFESIGRPLPGRNTIIISRNPEYRAAITDHGPILRMVHNPEISGHRVPQMRERGLSAIQQVCGQADDKTDVVPCDRLRAVGCLVAPSLAQAIALCPTEETIFIAGGGEIYREALPLAESIYLTVLDREVEGDILFPEFDSKQFRKISEEREEGPEPYTFTVFARH